MTEKQIKEYEKLSKLKEQYEKFIAQDGYISIAYYSSFMCRMLNDCVKDDEFKDVNNEVILTITIDDYKNYKYYPTVKINKI